MFKFPARISSQGAMMAGVVFAIVNLIFFRIARFVFSSGSEHTILI